jgi:DNA topoisomerase-3
MRLIVAEKPSMGRALASALGVSGAGQGCIEGRREVITWCIGHLVELAAPDEYDPALKQWSLTTLPIVPAAFRLVEASASTSAQLRVVLDLLRRPDVDEVVNACDSGREGELIFDHVYRHARVDKRVLRLWTASLTEEAIRTAYQNLRPAHHYARLRDAARSRSEADWLVGLNATRAQTLVAQRGGDRGVWSLGRVQTPTLALVVDRDLAIATFQARSYWTVDAQLAAAAGTFTARWFRTDGDQLIDRLDDGGQARELAARAGRGPAVVRSVESVDVRTPPERLYDLTSLQREANRRFGLSAAQTLEIAQALYETHKVLSYPRTSSRHLTTDVERTLPRLLEQLEQQPSYAGFASAARATGPRALGRRFVDDDQVEDHHALLPTGRRSPRLSEMEASVYDLVVRRLLAAYQSEVLESRTTVVATLAGELFRARGTVLVDAGWRRVDPPTAAKDKDKAEAGDDPVLPPVVAGERLRIVEVAATTRRTKPPKPFTEAELLGAMETAGRDLEDEDARLAMRDSGLGTPATRAATIEGLLKREFIVRERRQLRAAPRGLALIRGLQVPALRSAALTGAWEAKLARMARGQYDRSAFMAEIVAYTRELVDVLQRSEPPRPEAAPAPPARTRRRAAGPATRAMGNARAVPHAAPATANATRTAAPAPMACGSCRGVAKVVWSSKKSSWYQRCEPCNRWLP